MRLSHLFIVLFAVILLTSCASFVMTYVSLAVPIGPWIDPTLALFVLMWLQMYSWLSWPTFDLERWLLIVLSAAGIGGIVGTAAAWSFPTLYFLNADQAQHWLYLPMICIVGMGSMILVAGGFGLVIARLFGTKLVENRSMTFPVAQLVVQTVEVKDDVVKGASLVAGMVTSGIFHTAQEWGSLIPRIWHVTREMWIGMWRIPALNISLVVAPMVWAIGFTTGHVIAVPFAVGILLKSMIFEPCYRIWFTTCLSEQSFMLACCTGLVIFGALQGFWQLLNKLVRARLDGLRDRWQAALQWSSQLLQIDVVLVLAATFIIMYLGKFSCAGWLYLVLTTAVSCFQLMLLMGRTGLAPFPRFATFVMVPGLVLFGYSPFQCMLVTAFVEIAGGVAAIAASGYKINILRDLRAERPIYGVQWMALVISAICVATLLYTLAAGIGLGSELLTAQRCQARALLIQAHDMNLWVIVLGMCGGLLLQLLNINGTLVLGGLLMPLDWSLLLIGGGLLASCTRRREDYYPLWSGIFMVSSLWIGVRAVMQVMVCR